MKERGGSKTGRRERERGGNNTERVDEGEGAKGGGDEMKR